ncbi:MAG TPA: PEP-CTERM sorting domain-containing protein [Bryobacteraceae bacterium]|nr:PEP-CTERM sorting domain-containing protein [Bryobacteraceae bacterium]
MAWSSSSISSPCRISRIFSTSCAHSDKRIRRQKMINKLAVFCFAALLLIARAAHADSVTLQFSGSVTQVPVDQVFGDMGAGDPFKGTITFDPSAADQAPDVPSVGSYVFNSPFGMDVSIGKHNFEASGFLNIEIVDSFVDQLTVLATSETGSLTMSLFFLDNSGTALDNDHLPLSLSSLAGFDQRDFHLDGFLGDGEIDVEGEIAATPEPSSLALLCALALAMCVIARRTARACPRPSRHPLRYSSPLSLRSRLR